MIKTLLTTSALVALLAGGALADTTSPGTEGAAPADPNPAVQPSDVGVTPQAEQPSGTSDVANPTAPQGEVDHNRATNRNRMDSDEATSGQSGSQLGEKPNDRMDGPSDGMASPTGKSEGSSPETGPDLNRATNNSGG